MSILRASLLLTFLLSTLLGQSGQQPTFRVRSNVVLVDLIVEDGEGRFVTDLTATDLEVLEDGERREIAFLELQQPPDEAVDWSSDIVVRRPELALAPPPQAPPTGALLAFVVDLENLQAADISWVRRSLRNFLTENRQPTDRFMLLTLKNGMQIKQPFTHDAPAFEREIEALRQQANSDMSLFRYATELERLLEGGDLDTFLTSALVVTRQYLQEAERALRTATRSLETLVDDLALLPGRKNVVYFSAGYALRKGIAMQQILETFVLENFGGRLSAGDRAELSMAGAGSDLTTALDRLIRRANRAQVSFYGVDARGLTSGASAANRGGNPTVLDQVMTEEQGASQEFLGSLASGTGGRSFLYSNDLGRGVRQAYREATHYYTLGYSPVEEDAGKQLHRIQVRSRRPGLKIRYRRAYREPKRAAAAGEFDLSGPLAFPGAFQDFPFLVETIVEGRQLRIGLRIPTSHLVLREEPGGYRCDIEVYVALTDRLGRLVGGKLFAERSYRLEFETDKMQSFQEIEDVVGVATGLVEPGTYSLRLVVRQPLAGKVAAFESRLKVN